MDNSNNETNTNGPKAASTGRKARGEVTPRTEDVAPAMPRTTSKQKNPAETKADTILKRLKLAKGASVLALVEATGWQAHSVRGFLSGTVKKKLGLPLTSEVGKDGVRRYRIASAPVSG